MSRTEENKLKPEKKNTLKQIIVIAKELFFTNGYENTSVNQIIEQVGIAKGTFYHHFKSKVEVLDRIVAEDSIVMHEQYFGILSDSTMDAPTKLSKIFEASTNWEKENIDLVLALIAALYLEDNFLIRDKMAREFMNHALPVFIQIIKQGKEEGSFDIDDAEYTAEFLMYSMAALGNNISILLLESQKDISKMNIIEGKVINFEKTINKILGTKDKKVTMFDSEHFYLFQEEVKKKIQL